MPDRFENLKNTIENKRCAVLGLGVSNLPLVKLLLGLTEPELLTVYDKKSVVELGEAAEELADKTASQVVIVIGNKFVLYKRSDKNICEM